MRGIDVQDKQQNLTQFHGIPIKKKGRVKRAECPLEAKEEEYNLLSTLTPLPPSLLPLIVRGQHCKKGEEFRDNMFGCTYLPYKLVILFLDYYFF
ncbi:hypothetical protein V2J09_008615 [Rumex salicifolius]